MGPYDTRIATVGECNTTECETLWQAGVLIDNDPATLRLDNPELAVASAATLVSMSVAMFVVA